MDINKEERLSIVSRLLSRTPHAITMLFGIIVLVSVLTYILPAGTYDRVLLNGRNVVVPNSYTIITSTPIDFLGLFKAIPLGFKSAADIIFVVFAGAIMFAFMEKSKAVENSVGTLLKRLGFEKKHLLIVIFTFI